MIINMKILKIKTNKREEIIDITKEVNELIKDVKNGSVLVFSKHTTTGLTINENDDPVIKDDLLDYLSKAILRGKWRHDVSGRCNRGNNADAHIKASLIGNSKLIPIENGKLALGEWQSLWLCEFDGPREREILVQKNAM